MITPNLTPFAHDIDSSHIKLPVPGITIPTTAGAPMVVQQGLKITEQLIQKVEVVYVLGLFLLGKHRKKVSEYL